MVFNSTNSNQNPPPVQWMGWAQSLFTQSSVSQTWQGKCHWESLSGSLWEYSSQKYLLGL